MIINRHIGQIYTKASVAEMKKKNTTGMFVFNNKKKKKNVIRFLAQ